MVHKAMCLIIQKSLVNVVEERQLLAEEQGGFRRGKGCGDQTVTLTLLGETIYDVKKTKRN